ncbi:hypothetical protein GCM10025867_50520 (plasmid) [Frondihabitans sucicola]|uniref:Uncharacterized protein n=1 Tax=Frondihabitans sucicola TaxID=1268041 RepID=A0ABM8GWG5_9MICO|nr:hypothetical protein [Frondihabitans sucicola]BDZ52811.1 hypothetical protein GCM10025867_50520 [Frondihabitans sucicola]
MSSTLATPAPVSPNMILTPEVKARTAVLQTHLGLDSRTAMYCVLADRGQLRFLTTGVPDWLKARRRDWFGVAIAPKLSQALDHYMPGWRYLTQQELDIAWHIRKGVADPLWDLDYLAALTVDDDAFNPDLVPWLDRFRTLDRGGKLPVVVATALSALWPAWNKRKRTQSREASGRFQAPVSVLQPA